MKLTKKTIIAIIIAVVCVVGAALILSMPKNNEDTVSTQTEAPITEAEGDTQQVETEGKNDTAKEEEKAEDNKDTEKDAPKNEANAEEQEVDPTANDENINGLDKPIFMYFVTNADLENKDTKATLDKLQAEYKDKVIFEIKNADEDKSLYDNFPIKGSMPMLIMQKKGGDISNFLFSNNNYDELKAAIDATL
ncbi:MAG: hypothetical protein E7417_02375 [Ruminococcaceae bacterium]|nr:hypothetical protein [Oscillospiraceae bacterium]